MRYAAMLLLVSFAFAQSSRTRLPEEVRLPNGRVWSDVIATADHERNLKDADRLLTLATEVRADVEEAGKFVLSVKTLKKLEEAEKLAKDMRSRMSRQ